MTKNNFHTPRNPDNREPRENRDRDNSRDNRGGDRRNHDRRDHNRFRHNQRPKKSLILLKSTVFALFIVLVTLVAAFVLVKNNKLDLSFAKPNCPSSTIVLKNKIQDVAFSDGEIILFTEGDKNKEIIRIDAKCGEEINRIKFEQN